MQERAKARVDLILDATRQILVESGIEGVTTASVAKRAGVPVGSIYQYFPNKKAILLALYETYLEEACQVVKSFAATLPSVEHWSIALDRFMDSIESVEFDPDIESILIAAVETYPELREYEQHHMERLVESTIVMLRRLGSRWRKPQLRRLAIYLYMLNSAAMTYRRKVMPPTREVTRWDRAVARTLVAQCLAD